VVDDQAGDVVVGVANLVDPEVVYGDGRCSWSLLRGRCLRRWVDPHGGRQIGRVLNNAGDRVGEGLLRSLLVNLTVPFR
jgi:hypothetical protein